MQSEAYFDAIERGDTEKLRRLVADDPGLLAARQQIGYTGLHTAVYAEQSEAARVLIEAGIDIEARTTDGRTALHDSIEFDHRELRDLLLDSGAEVDICAAAILGRLDRVRELLDGDERLVHDQSTQLSPLGWAAYGNQVETARELIDRGARTDDGALLCAAAVGHVEVGRLLLERGADPDLIHPDAGANALHAAAAMKYAHDSRPFITMLIEAGADIHARTVGGKTAAEIAEEKARHPDGQHKPFIEAAALLRNG